MAEAADKTHFWKTYFDHSTLEYRINGGGALGIIGGLEIVQFNNYWGEGWNNW